MAEGASGVLPPRMEFVATLPVWVNSLIKMHFELAFLTDYTTFFHPSICSFVYIEGFLREPSPNCDTPLASVNITPKELRWE